MKTTIYLVVAYKNGDRCEHTYTVAAYAKKHAAIKLAGEQRSERGGKYAFAVEEIELGSTKEPKEVYRAYSNNESDRQTTH